jgi:hypothetical protein
VAMPGTPPTPNEILGSASKETGDSGVPAVPEHLKRTATKGIPGVPDHWQNFFLCMSFHILLPLLPLALELWRKNGVSTQSATLVAAMYAISIGGSSRSKLIFGLGVIISIVFSVAFGLSRGKDGGLPGSQGLAIGSILFIILTHGIERYNRHVAERTPFWVFLEQEE